MAETETNHELDDLVAAAYRTFDYPTPSDTEVCRNCCMTPDIEKNFFVPARRDLPLDYLRDWFSAACDTGGVGKPLWGYLLPRIVELLVEGMEVAGIGNEVALSRFPTGSSANWSPVEWSILNRFQRAYLVREAYGSHEFLDDTLCMFGNGGWPVADLLDQVGALPDEVLAQRLWNDWCQDMPGREAVQISPFWKGSVLTDVRAFYYSDLLRDRMLDLALSEHVKTETAQKALAVAEVILAADD